MLAPANYFDPERSPQLHRCWVLLLLILPTVAVIMFAMLFVICVAAVAPGGSRDILKLFAQSGIRAKWERLAHREELSQDEIKLLYDRDVPNKVVGWDPDKDQ